jgi:hypothetical protein
MSLKTQVKMTVPLNQEEGYSSQFVFSRWLPGEGEALIHTHGGFTVRYWADSECLNHIGGLTAEEIPRTFTILVGKVQTLADFAVENEKLRVLAEYCSANRNYSEQEIEQLFGAEVLKDWSFANGPSTV